ncbi:MAG TPA: diphthine--ammonia ligase [Candidatus Limnocylindrales bacterium]|nr:diphthine--ammonia ligase [Candidatus Limnocylindrales bacterium]
MMVINSAAGNKIFVSWSGGKDSYLSLLRAVEQGLEVAFLLCFIGSDGQSRSHGLSVEMLRYQAEALAIPLETEEVTWESYENGFERAVGRLKERGVTGGVFGDINLPEHREWVEKMCNRCAIDFNLPLWHLEERKVSEELVKRGGKALIVSIRSDLVNESWLGKFIDEAFLDYCEGEGISPCGEGGESHSLVVGGPRFRFPLKYYTGEVVREAQRALLAVYKA